MADDDALVRDAQALPWEERFAHAHWRVRSEAYAAVTAAAGGAADATASPLAEFGARLGAAGVACAPRLRAAEQSRRHGVACAGALANKATADGNANALDGGLEALVAFLARADEDYASRCAPPAPRRAPPQRP
jgi:hypothetical protein